MKQKTIKKIAWVLASVLCISIVLPAAILFALQSKEAQSPFRGVYDNTFTAFAEEAEPDIPAAEEPDATYSMEIKGKYSLDKAYLLLATNLDFEDYSQYEKVGYIIEGDDGSEKDTGSNRYYTGITFKTNAEGDIGTQTMEEIFAGNLVTGMIVTEILYEPTVSYTVTPYWKANGQDAEYGNSVKIAGEAKFSLKVEAEDFDEREPSSGHVSAVTNEQYSGGAGIGWIYSGDYTVYKGLDFKAGNLPTRFTIYYRASSAPEISVRIDGATGTEIAHLYCSGGQELHACTVNISGLTAGTHDIYLCFINKGGTSDFVEVDYFTFENREVKKIEAENFFEKNPSEPNSQVQVVNKSGWSGDKAIGWINPGNFTAYEVNFEEGKIFDALTVYYAANGSTLQVSVKIGSAEGTTLTEFTLGNTQNKLSSFTVELEDSVASGEQKIYFCFGAGGADIDYFEFVSQ